MADLKFYRKERIEFKESFDTNLSYEEVEIVFKKLCRHYKVNPYLTYGRGSHANFWKVQISNQWGKNIGVICHELAHSYCFKNGIKKGHHKKMWKVMSRMINYCKRHNYWQEELCRRTEVKMPVVLSKQELQLKKLEKRKSDLFRYEKQLKRYTKLYSNKIKKARRSIMMLERNLKPV